MFEASSSPARILIIDDDSYIRAVLRELLCERYNCVAVSSAEEALVLLRAEKFTLVLSDIVMAGISGLELVPHVLQLSPETVIVLISGEQTVESAIGALRVGAFDYITKPFDLRHVVAVVERALEHYSLLADKRRYEEHLRLLKSVAVNANDAVLITEAEPIDSPGPRIVYANESFSRMTGYAAEEVLGKTPRILQGRKTDRSQLDKLRAAFTRWEPVKVEIINYRKDGSEFWVELNIVPISNESGRYTHWVSVQRETTERRHAEEALQKAHDELEIRVEERTRELRHVNTSLREQIAERERVEQEIQYLAYHDALTDLPNRTLFEDRFSQALLSAQPNKQMLAVMFLNLDRFKMVNDTLGHAVGDLLLCDVAERLKKCVGEGDTVARLGSDEFSLLLRHINTTEHAADMAGKIQDVLRAPFNYEGHELFISASIGIVLHPCDGADMQTLLKNASAALYRAKQQDGDNYQFYTAGLHELTIKRHSLENKLRRALERGEFTVYYQSQVCTEMRRIVGMEALVRWQNPDLGLISPAEFIPLAEDSGLIVPIGEWVLRTACTQTKAWQDAGYESLKISVNISPRQFQQPDLVNTVVGILEETGLHPSSLELELTESSVMDNTESVTATLLELKEKGINLSIDDFGSGYSSLSYLKNLPIDSLKIDQSFVRDTTSDPRDAAIIMAIISLAHSLKLKVKAEGVETEEQFRFLRLLNCDEMQGYLFSRPLPAPAFEQLLVKEWNVKSAEVALLTT